MSQTEEGNMKFKGLISLGRFPYMSPHHYHFKLLHHSSINSSQCSNNGGFSFTGDGVEQFPSVCVHLFVFVAITGLGAKFLLRGGSTNK